MSIRTRKHRSNREAEVLNTGPESATRKVPGWCLGRFGAKPGRVTKARDGGKYHRLEFVSISNE